MESPNRGYLREPFRFFALRDQVSLREIDYHHHSFHKLLLFQGGCAQYVIEGKRYPLEPGDVVLVPRGCVHRPEADVRQPYRRFVLYLDAAFLAEREDCPLDICFLEAQRRFSHVLRLPPEQGAALLRRFRELEAAVGERASGVFGAGLLAELLVRQLLLELCRISLSEPERPAAQYDGQIIRALQLIGERLTGELTVDWLAERLFVSKYHLMRRFKEETGYSIHRYVTGKRLLLARELIFQGLSPTEACFRSGYREYSAFSRAYRKQFGVSPRCRESANFVERT